MTLDDRARLTAQLQQMEGLRLKPYRCPAGRLTIGYGRNLDDRGITSHEAAMLLENDITLAHSELARALPWFAALDGMRQAALVNMAFNMGTPTLLSFRATLQAVEQGKYDKAADGMLASLWAEQVPRRAQALAQQMRSGEWA